MFPRVTVLTALLLGLVLPMLIGCDGNGDRYRGTGDYDRDLDRDGYYDRDGAYYHGREPVRVEREDRYYRDYRADWDEDDWEEYGEWLEDRREERRERYDD